MANAKKNNTAAATETAPALDYAAAIALRKAAEERSAAASAQIEAERAAHLALQERLASGDDSITAGDLASAKAEIERAELLARAAATALAEAMAAERPLAAKHLAAILAPIVDPQPLADAEDRAAATIAAAIAELAETAAEQHATVKRAVATAKAFGTLNEPGLQLGHGAGGAMLILDGRGVAPDAVERVVTRALNAAAERAGWHFRSTPELRAIEARASVEPAIESLDNWESMQRLAESRAGSAK